MIVIRKQEKVSDPPVERGVVIEVTDETVHIQPHRHGACSSCGTSQICFPQEQEAPIIEANLNGEVNVGDIVELIHPEAPRIFAAFIVFGLPVIFIMIGLLLGMNATGQETQGGVAGALAGLAFGLFVVRFINRLVKTKTSLRPSVGRVLETSNADV
ncbi:positive regulator of sigma(E), RseC/MucC [bacterium BMS3Bbin04]|nr:positive regulator of sigma(E), RseC/MucC [bacterium BMS3Bbin04]